MSECGRKRGGRSTFVLQASGSVVFDGTQATFRWPCGMARWPMAIGSGYSCRSARDVAVVKERRAAMVARISLYIATDDIQQRSFVDKILVKSEVFWGDRLR